MNQIYYAILFTLRRRDERWELLMARRADDKYMGGTWQLISGRIEANETAWQAALRELREETGLAAREFYRLSSTAPFYRVDIDSICTGIAFCAVVDAAAEVRLDFENTAFAWHDLTTAADKLMWEEDRRALAEVRREIIADGITKSYLKIPLPE